MTPYYANARLDRAPSRWMRALVAMGAPRALIRYVCERRARWHDAAALHADVAAEIHRERAAGWRGYATAYATSRRDR